MIETTLNSARQRMAKAYEVSRNDLTTIRSGRATPSLVENMVISCYDGTQKMKLMEMATISAADAKTIVISPYDVSVIAEIEKGINEHNVGLHPIIDGEILRISIPPLSTEQRNEFIKLAHTKLEAGRIMVRQVRQDAMKELKRLESEGTISEDEMVSGEKQIQELTDEMIAEIDSLGKRKEEELLQI